MKHTYKMNVDLKTNNIMEILFFSIKMGTYSPIANSVSLNSNGT